MGKSLREVVLFYSKEELTEVNRETPKKYKMQCLLDFRIKKRTNKSKGQNNLCKSLENVSRGVFRIQLNISDGGLMPKQLTGESC